MRTAKRSSGFPEKDSGGKLPDDWIESVYPARLLQNKEMQGRLPRKQRFTTKRMHSSLGCDLRHDELKDSHPSDMMWFLLLPVYRVTDQGKSSVQSALAIPHAAS